MCVHEPRSPQVPIKKIWYNHAVRDHPQNFALAHAASPPAHPFPCAPLARLQIVPLWGAIGLASVVCGGFLIKYFAGHTEITWSKSLRATFDHQVRRRGGGARGPESLFPCTHS